MSFNQDSKLKDIKVTSEKTNKPIKWLLKNQFYYY